MDSKLKRWLSGAIAAAYLLVTLAPPAQAAQTVTNVAGLKALTRAQGRYATTLGFTTAGDGGGANYFWSAGGCSGANDGGSEVAPTTGSGCWKRDWRGGEIDVRSFGAIPDNTTDSHFAFVNAIAYAGPLGACVKVPAVYPGFKSMNYIDLEGSGSNCVKGERGIKNFPGPVVNGATFGTYADINFPNDTHGFVLGGNNGIYLGGLSIKGSAQGSKLPFATYGIYLLNQVEGKVENVFTQNFTTEREYGSTGAIDLISIFSDNQGGYPNIINGYPRIGVEMTDTGHGKTSALHEWGGEVRAQAGQADTTYTQANDPATSNPGTWFTVCPPTSPVSQRGGHTPVVGTQFPCEPLITYGLMLWRADGIKARAGATTTLQNGQGEADGPLLLPGVDFQVYDVSSSGGGGTGGTLLYARTLHIVTTSGTNTVTTVGGASTSGIPIGSDVLITSDHGLQLATKVQKNNTGTNTLTLSRAPYATETDMTVTITKIAVGTTKTTQATLTGAAIAAVTKTVSSLTSDGRGTATATTSTAHGLTTGSLISISGANQGQYNINTAVTVTSATTFTFPVGNYPNSPATGTITAGWSGLTLASVSGALAVGQILFDSAGNVAPDTVITGGSGLSWVVSGSSQTVASETMTAVYFDPACQAAQTCGAKVEVRFIAGHVPSNSTALDFQWSDPTGYAGYMADEVSDALILEPTLVGGYDVGFKYPGISDGSISWKPAYAEILNRPYSIERTDIPAGGSYAPFGTIVDMHRTVNDPLTFQGFVDNLAAGTKASFNNNFYYVAKLPAFPGIGAEAWVTDADACTRGATPGGGASTVCKLYYNGTAWKAL